jgi:hypothetical protein
MGEIGFQQRKLLWCGENSDILLKPGPDAIESTCAGFYRVDYSPGGSGQALFIATDVEVDGKPLVAIFADNTAMAEFIGRTMVPVLPEFANQDFSNVSITPARFTSMPALSAKRRRWTELVSSDICEIRLDWLDVGEPFGLSWDGAKEDSIPFASNTILYPAKDAVVEVNGVAAGGEVQPDKIINTSSGETSDEREFSSAFLALSETWFEAE